MPCAPAPSRRPPRASHDSDDESSGTEGSEGTEEEVVCRFLIHSSYVLNVNWVNHTKISRDTVIFVIFVPKTYADQLGSPECIN